MNIRVRRWHSLVVLVMLLAVLVTGPAVVARNDNPSVLPPNAKAFGKSYEEWSVAWRRRVFAQPIPTNPLLDETGEDCAVGQEGKVWFLAGNFGGTVERDCTIPTGTALFFPVLNAWADNIGVDPPLSEQGLIDACTGLVDDPVELAVTIDDTTLKNLERYRIEPTFFSYTLPEEDNLLDFLVPGNDFPTTPPEPGAVSCGYYVLVRPLPPGEHTLQIVTEGSSGFQLDVTYHLTVEKGKHRR